MAGRRNEYWCWRCLGWHRYGSAAGAQCGSRNFLYAIGLAVIALVTSPLWTQPLSSVLAPDQAWARTPVTSARVTDGDTIRVQLRGHEDEQRVRVLGIDTPELEGPNRPKNECFGPAATKRMRTLLRADGDVTLIADPTQADKDKYGRLLRYVEVGGRDAGATLIKEGYAEVMAWDPPVSQAGTYEDLEAAARKAGRGQWGACAR